MARRLIKDSVIHLMQNYHIDGFRFDLAKMIDWQTIDEIREAALQINPNVILIAEPWGGGYDPDGFSDHGWGAWNDQIRNGVKGQNPEDGLGFIFGEWQGENDLLSLQRYITGSLREKGGQYLSSSHSVNYLESHDDHTLGDFIRLGLGDVGENEPIKNLEKHTKLTPLQMKINKLAALFLFISQGPIMIHEGQEYARSKVIAHTTVPEKHINMIDHNSYNKDNETNWLNYDHAALNRELLDYYRGLIRMRKAHPAFAQATQDQYTFHSHSDSLFISFTIDYEDKQYLVFLNGNRDIGQEFKLPAGKWGVLADQNRAGANPYSRIKNRNISISPGSGMILLRE
jgi:pullulanase/glycogen debranching enzyme